MPTPILQVDDLHVSYGPIRAVRGCSFHIDAGEIVALVGANGAGKTTTLRAVCNQIERRRGEVVFQGQPIGKTPTDQLARRGMLHIPEGRGTIASLTVRENLRLAYEVRSSAMPFEEALAAVFERFPRLHERLHQRAGTLSGGEQQMLALARAVANKPALLIVDEPSLGLAPVIIKEAFMVLNALRRTGIPILLVEQSVRAALQLADRAYVIRQGQIVLQGSASQLLSEPEVLRQYLGSVADRSLHPASHQDA
jgi:branched-chain amino acid transport system ATP-binding protein